ncbi:hypothetical protein WA158_001140 [Blastocystis sp. Blastoise]
MGLFGGALCYIAKTFSPWDHVAVIVRNPEDDVPYAVEVSFRGVKVVPAVDRIARSSAPLVAVRYLRTIRTPEIRQKAWDEAMKLNGKPYTKNINILARAGLTSPYKLYRSLLFNRSNHLRSELMTLVHEEDNANTNDFLYSILQNKRRHLLYERSKILNLIRQQTPSRLENKEMDSSFFCSHGTAHILKTMGILPQNVPSTEYMPYTFSSDVQLPLLQGANFSPEVYIRGHRNQRSYIHGQVQGKSRQEGMIIENNEDQFNIDVLINRLRLNRPFGRLTNEQAKQLISKGKIEHLLPGEIIDLSDPQKCVCIVDEGIIHINRWMDYIGERKVGIHGEDSIFGIEVFPDYGNKIARVCSHHPATIITLSQENCQDFHGESPMLHGMERYRLIRSLQQNKHFQHLSFFELLMFSSYFYKVQLPANEHLSRLGDYCDHILVIDQGHLYQKASLQYNKGVQSTYKTVHGNIFGCSTLIYGIPRRDDVYVGEHGATLFICDPTVFHYYTGEWCPSVMKAFNEFKDPLYQLKDAATPIYEKIMNSLDVVQSISNMYTQSMQDKSGTFLSYDIKFQEEINEFTQLMQMLFPFSQPYKQDDYVNEKMKQKCIEIYKEVQETQQNKSAVLLKNEEETSIIQSSNDLNDFIQRAQTQIQNVLILKEYDTQAIIRTSDTFRMGEELATIRLLYYAFVGKTASHVLTKDTFLNNGKKLGIISEDDELVQLLFKDNNEIDTSIFTYVLLHFKEQIPTPMKEYMSKVSDHVHVLLNDLPHQRRFGFNGSLPTSLANPYGLLKAPLPVALPLYYSMVTKPQDPSILPAVLAGIFGEILGCIPLYPTYTSAISAQLNLITEKKTLTDYIFPRRSKTNHSHGKSNQSIYRNGMNINKKVTTATTTATTTSTATSTANSMKSMKGISMNTVAKQTSDSVLDSINKVPLSKSVSSLSGYEVNNARYNSFSFLRGLPKYMLYITYRNLYQILIFPVCLRYIYDKTYTSSVPLPAQIAAASFVTGFTLPLFIFPTQKKFIIHSVEAVPIQPLSFLSRNYRGLFSTMLHSSLLLTAFLTPFAYFWMMYYQSTPSVSTSVSNDAHHSISAPVSHFDGSHILNAVTLGAVTYSAAYLATYPLNVFKRYKTLQGYQVRVKEQEIIRFSKNYKFMDFIRKRTLKQIYRGASPRLYNSLISISLGIVFAGCGYRFAYKDS